MTPGQLTGWCAAFRENWRDTQHESPCTFLTGKCVELARAWQALLPEAILWSARTPDGQHVHTWLEWREHDWDVAGLGARNRLALLVPGTALVLCAEAPLARSGDLSAVRTVLAQTCPL